MKRKVCYEEARGWKGGMKMVSTLSELVDYVKSMNSSIVIPINEVHYQTDGTVKIKDGEYDIAFQAMSSFASMVGVPAAYAKRIPPDLRSVNIEYFASRMDDMVNVVISDHVISEVKNADHDRTVGEILNDVMSVFGDCNVIQPDLNQKEVSFYIYNNVTIALETDSLHVGFYIQCPIWKGGECYCSPALIEPIDETCIELSVTSEFLMTHEKEEQQDFKTVLEFGKSKMHVIDEVLENQSKDLADIDHFLSHEGRQTGVNASNRRKISEEAGLSGAKRVAEVIFAILAVEQRTKNMNQLHKLAHLAGMAFYASDPRYCSACHQEIES